MTRALGGAAPGLGMLSCSFRVWDPVLQQVNLSWNLFLPWNEPSSPSSVHILLTTRPGPGSAAAGPVGRGERRAERVPDPGAAAPTNWCFQAGIARQARGQWLQSAGDTGALLIFGQVWHPQLVSSLCLWNTKPLLSGLGARLSRHRQEPPSGSSSASFLCFFFFKKHFSHSPDDATASQSCAQVKIPIPEPIRKGRQE